MTPDQGPAAGSNGIPVGGMQLRGATATARAALLKLAAAKLGVAEAGLTIAGGMVGAKDSAARVGFGDLLDGKAFDLKLDPQAPLKNPADYRIVGKAFARPDLPGKLNGQHVYVHDFKVPGMVHGRVIRPPTVGARLLSVDAASVAGIPGVQVVRMENFLAVVAVFHWIGVKPG